MNKNDIHHKKSPTFLLNFSDFAPPNVVLSNHFNEELLKFAAFYESKANSLAL
jgi:hypothetical protein